MKEGLAQLNLIEFYGMLIMTYSHGHVWLISNVKLNTRTSEFLRGNC